MMQRYHKNKVDFGSQYFYREFLKYKSHSDILPSYGIKYSDINKSTKKIDTNISQKVYTKILKTFFELAVKKIIHDAYRFILPGIGLFYLVRKEQKIVKKEDGSVRIQATINWPETKKLIKTTGDRSKKVFYINDHTDRHVYQITWDKRAINFRNKNFYIFAIGKKHRQYLKDVIMSFDKPLNAYESWY